MLITKELKLSYSKHLLFSRLVNMNTLSRLNTTIPLLVESYVQIKVSHYSESIFIPAIYDM